MSKGLDMNEEKEKSFDMGDEPIHRLSGKNYSGILEYRVSLTEKNLIIKLHSLREKRVVISFAIEDKKLLFTSNTGIFSCFNEETNIYMADLIDMGPVMDILNKNDINYDDILNSHEYDIIDMWDYEQESDYWDKPFDPFEDWEYFQNIEEWEDTLAFERVERSSEKIALYAGTFDPITNGHFDIIERALNIFDRLIIAVAISEDKNTMFSLEERIEMIKKSTAHLQNITIVGFNNLTVDLAKEHNAKTLVRGLRSVTDFEYELQLGYLNNSLDKNIETIYLMTKLEHTFISSSIVRNLIKFNGKTEHLIPFEVEEIIEYIKEKDDTTDRTI